MQFPHGWAVVMVPISTRLYVGTGMGPCSSYLSRVWCYMFLRRVQCTFGNWSSVAMSVIPFGIVYSLGKQVPASPAKTANNPINWGLLVWIKDNFLMIGPGVVLAILQLEYMRRIEVWWSGLRWFVLVNILYRRLSSAANRFSIFPQTSTSSLFQLFQEAFHILHLILEKPISQCRIASPGLSLTLNQVLWDRSEALIFWQSSCCLSSYLWM